MPDVALAESSAGVRIECCCADRNQAVTVSRIAPHLHELDNAGVRIEDEVPVTTEGVRSLTRYTKVLTLAA